MGRARTLLLDQIRQADSAGHHLDLRPVTVRFSRAGNVIPNSPGHVAWCSCGWESRPRPTRNGALAASMLHIGALAADGFPQADDTPNRGNVLHQDASGL